MLDILETLRFKERSTTYEMPHHIFKRSADEIERLRLWIRRIDNINDNPAHFSKEIDQACIDALAGKPMVGRINALTPEDSARLQQMYAGTRRRKGKCR